uniref:7TM_GPCR_Srx domain-containing protein n=1 Tax=Steinernema glaseri TaxID=37863 RepID=A0A1I7ZC16_9BILA
MTQIGILQLSAVPLTLMLGTMQLANHDPLSLASFAATVYSSCKTVEVLLGLVLAINRLCVITHLDVLSVVCKMLTILSWIHGIVTVIVNYTPLSGYYQLPGRYLAEYDMTKPYSWLVAEVDSYLVLVAIAVTLLVYVVIVSYLLRLRSQGGDINSSSHERSILLFAGVRFLFDLAVQLAYSVVTMPESDWSDLSVALVYILSSLLLSPILYLVFTKSLRHDFLNVALLRRHIRTISVGTAVSRATIRSDK